MIIGIKDGEKALLAFVNERDGGRFSPQDFYDKENIPVGVVAGDEGTIYGFAHSLRSSDIFTCNQEFLSGEITPRGLICKTIPAMKKRLDEEGLVDGDDWRNCLVICQGNRVFDVDMRFLFQENSDYVVRSYNSETMRSALEATKGLPARERVLKALAFAEDYLRIKLFPAAIVDTESRNLEIVEREVTK